MHPTEYHRSSFGSESPDMTPWRNHQKIPFSDHMRSRGDCSASGTSLQSSARILLPFRHCFRDIQKSADVETLHECTSSRHSKLPFAHLLQHRCAVSHTPEHVEPAHPIASKSSTFALLQAHRNRFVSGDSQAVQSSSSSKFTFVHFLRSGSKQNDSRVSQTAESSSSFKLPPGVFLKHEHQLPQSQEHHTILSTTASSDTSATTVSKEASSLADVPVTYSKLSEAPSGHSSAHTMKHGRSTSDSWQSATTSSTLSSGTLSRNISAHVKRLVRKVEPLIGRIENRIEDRREARQILKKQAKDNAPPKKHFLRATKSNDLTSVIGHLKGISSHASISTHDPTPDIPISDEPETPRPALQTTKSNGLSSILGPFKIIYTPASISAHDPIPDILVSDEPETPRPALQTTKSIDLTSLLGHLEVISSPASTSAHESILDILISDEPETPRPATAFSMVAPMSECRTPTRQTAIDEEDEYIFYTPASRMLDTSSPASGSAHNPIPDIAISDEPETSRPATPLFMVAPMSECRTPTRQTTTDEGDEDIFYTPASRMLEVSC